MRPRLATGLPLSEARRGCAQICTRIDLGLPGAVWRTGMEPHRADVGPEVQEKKLRLVAEVARAVWGG